MTTKQNEVFNAVEAPKKGFFSANGTHSKSANSLYKDYVKWFKENPTKRKGNEPLAFSHWTTWAKKTGLLSADGSYSADSTPAMTPIGGVMVPTSTLTPPPPPAPPVVVAPAPVVKPDTLMDKLKRNKFLVAAVVIVVIGGVIYFKKHKKKA